MDNKPFPAGSKVIAYLRDSGGREQDQSILQQEKAIGEFSKDNGYILTRVFKDEARSGTTTKGRDAFIEMIAYIRSKPDIAGVLVWELSRFSRDYNHTQYYLADIRMNGYIVYSMTDDIPQQGNIGSVIESIKAWKNEDDIEQLRIRVKRGIHYQMEVNHIVVGHPPFGYKMIDKQTGVRRGFDEEGKEIPHMNHVLAIDTETAPIVKDIFEMRAAGATYKEIDEKYHLYRTMGAYGKFLTNRRYLGEWQHVKDYCPPIISEELFNAAQVINNQRASDKVKNHPRVIRSRFILSGLLHCMNCKQPMYGSSTSNVYGAHYDYYRCTHCASKGKISRRIPKNEMEYIVFNTVINRALQPDQLQAIYEKAKESLSKNKLKQENQKQRIKSQLKSINSQINRILSAIKDTGHSQALLTELKKLEDERDQYTIELTNLDTIQPVPELPDIQAYAEKIPRVMQGASNRDKADLIREIVLRIEAKKVDDKVVGMLAFWIPNYNSDDCVVPLLS